MAKGEKVAKFAQDLPPWAKGVIAIAALGGGYMLVRKLTKAASGPSKKETEGVPQNTQAEINQLSKTQKLTYPVSNYTAFANQLKQAFYSYGTDEAAVFSVFGRMKNDLDVATLTKAFGVFAVEPSIWRPFDFSGSGDLATWIVSELSTSDIQIINQGFAKNGIKYRF